MNAQWSGTWLAATIAVLAHPAFAAIATSTNTCVRTVSASRQFIASAGDRILPSALCAYAEHVKREWLRRLDMADDWRDPILVLVETRPVAQATMPPVSIGVFQTDDHLEYRIRCLVPPPIDETELLPALVDALCSEWANRHQPTDPSKAYVAPGIPLWLVDGLTVLIDGRRDALQSISQRSVVGGKPPEARDLLNANSIPTDSAERQLFQADAWILTDGLLKLRQGSTKLRDFLTELGVQKVASNAFWKVYRDDFPNVAVLEKWWSLELVLHSSMSVAQDLTVEDTRHGLDEILMTRLGPVGGRRGMPGNTDVSVDDLWRYADASWLKNLLKLKIDRIGALRGVAHPLYLPVLDDYMEALVWLQRGSVTRFHRVLTRAETARAVADKRAVGIAAYLDDAERVYAPDQLSSTFRGYFQTFDQLEKLDSERHSPISDYLDKFDH